jgi:putative cell wall-binding protein
MVRRRVRRVVFVAVLIVGGFAVSTRASADGTQVDRIAGMDRFETAARVSQGFAPGREVYIATGENFPDSLSAGPAIGRFQVSILLVTKDTIPDVTRTELQRLQPQRITVVGGPSVISDGVVSDLQNYGPTVRVAGGDRYATSIAVSQDAYEPGVEGLLIATGREFPDALLAGAAGALVEWPLLLVDGQTPLRSDTIAEIQRLQPKFILISGDFNAVSFDVEKQLSEFARVGRAGENAYNRGAIFWSQVPTEAIDIVLVTGANFPDGLAAAAFAGQAPGRVTYLVPPNCVPPAVANEIGRLHPTHITLIGGPAALSTDVEHLVRCP